MYLQKKLWSGIRKAYGVNPPLTARNPTASEESAAIKSPAQGSLVIGNDSWKQKYYENNLKAITSYLNGEQDSVFNRSHRPSINSGYKEKILFRKISTLRANLKNTKVDGVRPKADPRKRYKKMLVALREAHRILQKIKPPHSSYITGCSELVQGVSNAMFMAPRDSGFYTELVQTTRKVANESSKVLAFTGQQIASRLRATQVAVRSQRKQLESASGGAEHLVNVAGGIAAGELGINYDPYLQGNQPYPLLSFTVDEQEVTCIRMGTPTRQTFFGKEGVTPEFRMFLESLPADARHLYINRQKRKGVEGGEIKSVRAFSGSTGEHWKADRGYVSDRWGIL